MSYRIIPTPRFQKDVKYLKKKYRHIASDLEEFNNILGTNPFYGEEITGLEGKVLKARLAIISKDFRTLWANNVLKQSFGDVEGKTCYSTYNKRSKICPKCGVQEIFAHGKDKVVHEQMGQDAAGNIIWSEITATPIRNREGSIVSAMELILTQ